MKDSQKGPGRQNRRGNSTGMGRGDGGRGRGRGMGSGTGMRSAKRTSPPLGPRSKTREIIELKSRAASVSEQLESIAEKISSLKNRGKPAGGTVAVADPEKCVSCGACMEVCPESAIRMEGTAVIDASRCRGCGACAEECPGGAISLRIA